MKTCDTAGTEDPVAAAAVSEMKGKLMELIPSEWKQDCWSKKGWLTVLYTFTHTYCTQSTSELHQFLSSFDYDNHYP